MLKLPFNQNNAKYTAEELANISLEEVKKMIIAQDPKAFDKKTSKKKATKKAPAKKKA